jgi:hypothetical protein
MLHVCYTRTVGPSLLLNRLHSGNVAPQGREADCWTNPLQKFPDVTTARPGSRDCGAKGEPLTYIYWQFTRLGGGTPAAPQFCRLSRRGPSAARNTLPIWGRVGWRGMPDRWLSSWADFRPLVGLISTHSRLVPLKSIPHSPISTLAHLLRRQTSLKIPHSPPHSRGIPFDAADRSLFSPK